jgi:hypothetical protein
VTDTYDGVFVPENMRDLPLDDKSRIIPWFVAQVDGRRDDLRVADGAKRVLGYRQKRCWLCGKPLDNPFAFVGGPLSVANRVFSDWACHVECAVFACRTCPFLNGTMSRRSARPFPEAAEAELQALPGFHPERPEYAAVYVTSRDVELLPEGLFRAGPPRWTWWFKMGLRVPEQQALPALAAARDYIQNEVNRVGLAKYGLPVDLPDRPAVATANPVRPGRVNILGDPRRRKR